MDLMLRDAAIMITGGSRGIGRAIALAFAAEGARVAICGRDETALAEAAALLRNTGVHCIAIKADMMNANDCRRVNDESVAAFGSLQVLVNNASTDVGKTPRSLEDAS